MTYSGGVLLYSIDGMRVKYDYKALVEW